MDRAGRSSSLFAGRSPGDIYAAHARSLGFMPRNVVPIEFDKVVNIALNTRQSSATAPKGLELVMNSAADSIRHC